ncbi:hypothetical protein A176_005641 [Myxococcus hansupus]|uniref:Uncharacterized protein n=1 Tax=Pseudomyxococcus hansupus TaxID=1297742 RepID=A0A0H4X0U5_9BACT|nr:hypothetical protein A176_005641 [Myxococcus hansupus]
MCCRPSLRGMRQLLGPPLTRCKGFLRAHPRPDASGPARAAALI